MVKDTKLIVLIEDEQTLVNILELRLKQAGYRVRTASNGKEGLALIRSEKPDLVLLDIMLPILDGFGVLEELHAEGVTSELPVIVISNSGQPVEVERVLKLGARDFLIKVNFDPDEVLEKVRKVWRKEDGGKKKTRSPGRHILLVEDDDIIAGVLARKLEQGNYAVHKVSSTVEARRVLEKNAIDVVLLDILLPDVSGFVLLEEIKAHERWRNIPVIIISNLNQPSEIEKGRRLGAVDYIVKTETNPSDLVRKVDTLFKK